MSGLHDPALSAQASAELARLSPGSLGGVLPEFMAVRDRFLQQAPDRNLLELQWQEAGVGFKRSHSAIGPSLTGSLEASRQEGAGSERFSLGLQARWEVDLWGRLRAGLDSQSLSLEAARANYAGGLISLEAQLADTYLSGVMLQHQLAAAELDLIDLKSLSNRLERGYERGLVPLAEVLNARQDLARKQQEIKGIRTDLSVQHEILAQLSGQAQSETVDFPARSLSEVPGKSKYQALDGALVMNRPDVQAAYYNWLSEQTSLKAREKARWPSLNLTLNATEQGISVRDLFDAEALLIRAAAGLTMDLIDSGRLENELELQRASVRKAYENFRRTLHLALREIAESQLQLQRLVAQREQISQQVASRRVLYEQTLGRSLRGLATLNDVTRARIQLRALETEHCLNTSNQWRGRIQLWRVLGGTSVEHDDG